MKKIVDLRDERADEPARMAEAGFDGAVYPSPCDGEASAEIILFPKFRRALARRPRKQMKRRFGLQKVVAQAMH